MTTFDESRQLIAEASQHLPGGVNSNYRLGIAPTPLVFERGEGPYLYDADGNRLIDYYLGMGPMILGHNPAPVLEAVEEQLRAGILYAGQSRVEQEAARMVCEMVPCAERVRFSCAGSEVVQAVIRLARAATQRSVIIKFEGHYHGWMDNILWSIAPTPEEYGPEGRRVYAWASPTLDTLFPIVYVSFFAGLIYRCRPTERLWWLAFIPVAAGIVDLGENIQITAMLIQYPDVSPAQAAGASLFTQIKGYNGPIYQILALLLLALAGVRRLLARRSDRTA